MSTGLREKIKDTQTSTSSPRSLPVQGFECLSLTCAGVGDLAVIMYVALHRTCSRCGPGEGILTVLYSTDEQRPGALGQAERACIRVAGAVRGAPQESCLAKPSMVSFGVSL